MTKLFENPEDLSEYIFRITDNGGATYDRYTVIFSDGSGLGLSNNPSSPIGFSQSIETIDVTSLSGRVEAGEEVDLALGDLDESIVRHILACENQGWNDYLERIEKQDTDIVATTRDKATPNEGLYTSAGEGIYMTASGYMIKMEGGVDDDLGPYHTAREALLHTLPTPHSLAGEEHHSTVEAVGSLTPTAGAIEKIAELEEIIESGHGPSI